MILKEPQYRTTETTVRMFVTFLGHKATITNNNRLTIAKHFSMGTASETIQANNERYEI